MIHSHYVKTCFVPCKRICFLLNFQWLKWFLLTFNHAGFLFFNCFIKNCLLFSFFKFYLQFLAVSSFVNICGQMARASVCCEEKCQPCFPSSLNPNPPGICSSTLQEFLARNSSICSGNWMTFFVLFALPFRFFSNVFYCLFFYLFYSSCF